MPPNPTNAGKIFRWGNKQWGDEFVTRCPRSWQVNHPSMVRNQHGMLTLDAPTTGTTSLRPTSGTAAPTAAGRRASAAGSTAPGGQPYTLYWELVPNSQPYHCGAGNLVLSQYTLGTNTAATHVRTLPNNDFTVSKALQLSDNEFHTYAVEVTPDHVSWFVDTKVIRTETRPAALAGVALSRRASWSRECRAPR